MGPALFDDREPVKNLPSGEPEERLKAVNKGFGQSSLNLLFCILCVLALGYAAEAQSGRRLKRSDVSPSPAPAIEAPQPAPVAAPALPRQKLIVGMDNLGRSMSIPLYMSDAVWDGFYKQFNKSSSFDITTETHMRGKEARERARKETESYVVLLQLETDSMDSGGLGQVDLNNLVVTYAIYAPVTGKTKETGRVYVRQSRNVLSLPTGRNGEAQLNQAGREAADRVMLALHIGGPAIMR